MTSILFTSITATIICFVFLIIFSFFRKKYSTFYSPKYFIKKSWFPNEPKTFFGWIPYTLFYPQYKILESSGIDAVLYMKYLKYCLLLLFILSILSCTFLLPINIIQGNSKENNFDSYSLANIPEGSNWLFCHLISVFLFSFITYYYIYKLHYESVQLELINSQYRHDNIINRTVMVTSLPKSCETDKDLMNIFQQLFGENKVIHTSLVPHLVELHILTQEREKIYKLWKRCMCIYQESNYKIRPKHYNSLIPLPFIIHNFFQKISKCCLICHNRSY
jgi:hypothetical protein